MKIREYITKIGENKKVEDMKKLGDMLAEIIYDMKESHNELYEDYKMELYEMAYGKVITKEIADEWVNSMKPFGKKWTIEETTSAMKSLGYNFKDIDFYVVANMMYNDYYELVKENETLALKMAYSWLKDEDAIQEKLYCYWKNIVKK